MKFNHLIQINDPLNPLIDPLTREQLWRGLIMRAEAPKLFMPHLDDCRLDDKSLDSVRRELRYGELVIRDKVTYLPQIQVLYEVPAQGEIAASRMSMTIEEPQEGVLFVRFEYDDGQPDTGDSSEAFYNEFRRSAYKEADIDTVRVIRELTVRGELH
ncbi:SRPBCC family protein [Herbaspirillum sp. WKF16]|uniref:SRPBCC family protein n=1 Tax=Herbaspirillum sp. WKF16 TaxID=3028312 RepID=UPI0023A91806|nr:SRPBCC family protein [Herbaspirillum sp. WKF16]WDZ95670.1 SRPBCC family protein [Herbaspirillum sp. WKF16]